MEKFQKPSWIKAKGTIKQNFVRVQDILRSGKLNTICEEGKCPNVGKCWNEGHVAFMILGTTCTRGCKFCHVTTGNPKCSIDKDEPHNIANAVVALNLRHVVITSVTRDDLNDGGASHFASCIKAIRAKSPTTTIEVLTPDFLNKANAVEIVVEAKPNIYNHNIETVPSLYAKVRQGARYFNSLMLLYKVKELDNTIFTKSGIMLGLGETQSELFQVMDDLRAAKVEFLTISQYLQPTEKHAELKRYVTEEEFSYYKAIAEQKGFSLVSSSPLTRSSFNAYEDFENLKKAKMMKNSNSE